MESLGFIVPAFVAGLLTFLMPCTLPLVPAYLAFISGVSLEDLEQERMRRAVRRKVFLNGFAFIIGFSIVFTLVGMLAGLIGSELYFARLWFARVGGVLVIFFGLFMLNAVRPSFLIREFHVSLPVLFRRGQASNSFLLGVIFATGWTPCIGPVLGSVLFLASASATAAKGALLLLVFSAGLAIPFLLIAWSAGSAAAYIERFTPWLKFISVIGGVFLIVLGVLLMTGNLGLIVTYGFRLFDFINYDSLIDYL